MSKQALVVAGRTDGARADWRAAGRAAARRGWITWRLLAAEGLAGTRRVAVRRGR